MENSIQDRGYGNWQFTLYKPDDTIIQNIEGMLKISKDFHWVMTKSGNCVFSVPNQNVACAVNLIKE